MASFLNENFNLAFPPPIPFFFLLVSLHAGSFLIGYSSLKKRFSKFSKIRYVQKVCAEEGLGSCSSLTEILMIQRSCMTTFNFSL